MKAKIRLAIVTSIFLFGLFTRLNAQDRYEYISVTFSTGLGGHGYYLSVAKGDTLNEVKVDKNDVNGKFDMSDLTPLQKKVNELGKEGWDAYSNTQTMFGGWYYVSCFLKRKLK